MTQRLVKRCGVSSVCGADDDGVRRVEEEYPRKWNCRCRRRLRRHSLDNLVVGRQGRFRCEDRLGG
jgi:hypothetical protein